MAGQTGFDVEDAAALLQQLQQFYEILQQEWSQVQNQWGSLQTAWHDQQFETFNPLYEQLSNTHTDTEQMCEQFISFLQGQIQTAQDRRDRMGELSAS
jgi:uncharacterized protein YukE